MEPHQPSLPPAYPVLHLRAPLMPVLDHADANFRAQNFRASMTACPSCWRSYFEILATTLEREATRFN